MKTIFFSFLYLLIISSVLEQTYESGKPTAWIDLTGEKYAGNDSDLIRST